MRQGALTPRPLRRHVRVLALVLVLGAMPCAADPAAAAPPLERIASYDLPRASVLETLAAIAESSGLRIVFPPATRELERARSAAISGPLSAASALDAALAGTGYAWRVDPHGTILVERAAPTPSVALEPLRIEDSRIADPDAGDAARDAGALPDRGLDERAAPGETLSGPALAARVVDRIDTLLERAPNVSGRGSSLAIRGIERGDDDAITATVYFDGIPVGGRALDFGLLGVAGLERVEYRRGPRSLWDGVGALAGTIELETAAPSPEPGARVALELDDAGARRGRASVEGPAFLDGLTGRVSLEQRHEPGFNDSFAAREIDRSRERSGQLKLLYEPDAIEPLTIELTALHGRGDPGQRRIRSLGGSASFDPFDRQSVDARSYASRVALDGARLAGRWRFGERAELALAGTWSETRALERNGFDLTRPDSFLQRDDDEERRELELRWTQRLGRGYTLLAGVSRAQRDVVLEVAEHFDLRDFYPAPDQVEVSPRSSRIVSSLVDTDVETDSVLLELERRGRRWDFALGARVLDESRAKRRASSDRLTEPDCTITIGGQLVLPCADEFPASASESVRPASETVTVPRALVRFRPNAAHALALGYREGYLGGGARLNVLTDELVDFQAERSESLDLSWDARWSERVSSRATLFYNRWRDRQVPIDQPDTPTIVVNAAEARAYGGELELRAELSRAWLAWLGVGALETEYVRFPFRVPGGSVELDGNAFAGAPALTVSAGLAWQGPRGWHASLVAWHSDEAYSDPRNLDVGLRPSYEVVDAKLGRRFGPWHVYGYVTNLTDEEYIEDIRVGGLVPSAREFELGRPRQVGVGVEWRW